MAFTIFESGTKACAGEMNDNFSSVMYSVLMNRMENDLTGQAQIDETIVSDNFNCACGRYKTINTINNTSVFDTDFYTNKVINANVPFIYTTTGYCCTVSGTDCFSFINVYNNGCFNYKVMISKPNCANVPGSVGVSCIEYTNCICNLNINFSEYCDISIYYRQNTNIQACSQAYASSCSFINFNGFCNTFNISGTSGGPNCAINCSWEKCICLLKKTGNTYCYLVNGSLICCIDITSFNYITINCYKGVANIQSMQCSPQIALSNAVFCTELVTKTVKNTNLNTTLKTYSLPKNATMLAANADLPAGNSITYDIYNQSNTKLLEGAEPNKIYNLSSTTDCSFYAVINQNVECNLCEPQKLYGYAFKFF